MVEEKGKRLLETLVLFSTFIFLATLGFFSVIGSPEFLSVTFSRLMEKKDSTQADGGGPGSCICTELHTEEWPFPYLREETSPALTELQLSTTFVNDASFPPHKYIL